MSQSKSMALELKAEGNNLFRQKNFAQAAIKFTKAIELDTTNAVLYSNRAACYLSLKRYEDALSDAEKATELDPDYAKAWGHLGAAHDGLTNYAESIESYQQAISKAESSIRTRYQNKIMDVEAKITNFHTMALSMLMAMAHAHDIPLPTPHTMDNMPAIRQAIYSHPKFGTNPLQRLLLIPQDEVEPLGQVELVWDSTVETEICKLLGCERSDSVVLHSQDIIAFARGKPDGVGVGRLHTSYEAYMDDLAVFRRPLNRRASTLLHRPDTHGLILVMKTTFIKAISGRLGRPQDIVGWEKITEAELKGEAFKGLREEWIAVMGSGDLPHVLIVG